MWGAPNGRATGTRCSQRLTFRHTPRLAGFPDSPSWRHQAGHFSYEIWHTLVGGAASAGLAVTALWAAALPPREAWAKIGYTDRFMI